MKKKYASLLAAILAIALLMTACVSNIPSGEQPKDTDRAIGTILLSVNPEIEIEYDSKGAVINIQGKNDEGKAIAAQCAALLGQPCDSVVTELVKKIYAAGYFEVEVDGKARNIVIKLEEGSAYPDDSFLEKVAASVRGAVDTQGGTSDTVVVGKSDLNEDGLIGLEKAKQLVLAQLDLTEAQFTEKEYELDDGVYELEFTAGGIEYEYEVDGRTGKILKVETEPADSQKPTTPPGQPAADLTMDEAKAVVFGYLGITEDQVTHKEFQFDDGKYELEFIYNGTEYEFDVDAKTGALLKIKQKNISVSDPPAPGALTLADAKALVFAQLGITENQVYELDTDFDDGRFEIDFTYNGYEYEFEVDPATGAVRLTDKEPADD